MPQHRQSIHSVPETHGYRRPIHSVPETHGHIQIDLHQHHSGLIDEETAKKLQKLRSGQFITSAEHSKTRAAIINAIETRNIDSCNQLLSSKDIAFNSIDGTNILMDLAEADNIEFFIPLFTRFEGFLPNELKCIILHEAIRDKSNNIMKWLLDNNKISIEHLRDFKRFDGSLLDLAIHHDNLNAVKSLRSKGVKTLSSSLMRDIQHESNNITFFECLVHSGWLANACSQTQQVASVPSSLDHTMFGARRGMYFTSIHTVNTDPAKLVLQQLINKSRSPIQDDMKNYGRLLEEFKSQIFDNERAKNRLEKVFGQVILNDLYAAILNYSKPEAIEPLLCEFKDLYAHNTQYFAQILEDKQLLTMFIKFSHPTTTAVNISNIIKLLCDMQPREDSRRSMTQVAQPMEKAVDYFIAKIIGEQRRHSPYSSHYSSRPQPVKIDANSFAHWNSHYQQIISTLASKGATVNPVLIGKLHDTINKQKDTLLVAGACALGRGIKHRFVRDTGNAQNALENAQIKALKEMESYLKSLKKQQDDYRKKNPNAQTTSSRGPVSTSMYKQLSDQTDHRSAISTNKRFTPN